MSWKTTSREAYAVLVPLVREKLWPPDGKPPKGWDDRREGSVLKRLLLHCSVSQLEVAIRGLAELRESRQVSWLRPGEKVTCRALYNSRSGTSQMFELATAAYWRSAKRVPRKPTDSLGSILFHITRQTSDYRDYVRSDAWRSRRERALVDAGYRCQRCPTCVDLEVHHLRYTNLGREPADDLEVLCWRCHRQADRERAGMIPNGGVA